MPPPRASSPPASPAVHGARRRAPVRHTTTPANADASAAWARAVERARRALTAREIAPTAVQRAAFDALPRGDDVLLVAPTGSGKTLAAALPLMSWLLEVPPDRAGVRVLYIAPVRALVAQQTSAL